MPNINLSQSIALFLYHEATKLVRHGLDTDLAGNSLDTYPPELDNIPSDTETFVWADHCVRFIRYFGAILARAIEDMQRDQLEPNIDSSIFDEIDMNIGD